MSWYKSSRDPAPKAGSWRATSLEEAKKALQERFPAEEPPAEAEPPPPPPPPDPEEEARKARILGFETGMEEGRAAGLDEGRAQGLAEGREEGLEAGKREAYEEHEAALKLIREEAERAHQKDREEFEKAISGFVNEAYKAIRDWKDEMTKVHTQFALEVAHRAVAQELRLSRDSAVSLAKEAMAELHQGVEFRILVNPADVAALESHRQEIVEIFSQIRGLEVAPDRTIHGGVVIESQSGTIDGRIEAYLQRMAEAALRERGAA